MAITPLPTPPTRNDPSTFSTRADAFLGALPTFVTEANTLSTDVNTKSTAATTSASAASTSASNAATSASAASDSASAAAASASAAATSASNASASYDAFDDRYLGSKASNPTTDNDGNALMVGAIYWNSTANEMRAYSGSVWAALNSGTVPQNISVNTSSSALKITQTGSGYALAVEDEASDTTPFVVNSIGNVGISINNPLRPLHIAGSEPSILLEETDQAVDAKLWRVFPTSSVFSIEAANDGLTVANAAYQIVRSGTAVDSHIFITAGTARLRIGNTGSIAMGGTPLGNVGLLSSRNITGSSSAYSVYAQAIVQSDVIIGSGFATNLGTQAAAFTLPNLHHFRTAQGTIGAGSSITSQWGYVAAGGMTGATGDNGGFYAENLGGAAATTGKTMYGFRSDISAASGGGTAYGFVALGNAPNHFNGLTTFTAGLQSTSGTVPMGYNTGAGGTVAQVTSKSTSVTLNKPTGQITMHNAALAAGASVGFAVSNSLLTANDVVIVNRVGDLPDNYRIETAYINTGVFGIRVTNITAGSLSQSVVLNFAIIKGATS